MRLKIRHVTEYRYDAPVQFSLQRLRLTPMACAGQTVVDWSIKVDGATVQAVYNDQFGNHVEMVSAEGDQDAVRIEASGTVETVDRSGVLGPHTGYCPLWLFLRETPLTASGPLSRAIATDLEGDSDLARMHALMGAIHAQVEYITDATVTTTTAEEALEQKSGVCQDHAHVFLAAARSLGHPARYVSGYLMMDDVDEQTATHAWAEVHLVGLGWVGFDAANNICPDERYVRIACGLDYRDAAPTSGMRIGTATENLIVSVVVQDTSQSQSQSQS